MGELFVVNGVRAGTLFPLNNLPVVVGRVPECAIHLADPWVSSNHARIEMRGKDLWLVDLQSTNGTFLGEGRIRELKINPGTRVRFGQTEVEFREKVAPPPETKDVLRQPGTVIRSLDELMAEAIGLKNQAGGSRRTLGGAMAKPDPVQLAKRQVAVLHELGRALIEAADLSRSLAAILTTAQEAVNAERSCLLLMDEAGGLQPMAYAPSGTPPRLSNTVVNAAIKTAVAERAGILILDAQSDERFSAARSIMAEGIRSCMCVPIWGDNRILGMMVMDRGFAVPFTPDDLELVTVVGYQAALAIDRMRFLEQARQSEEARKKLLRHFSPDVANMILSKEQLQQDPLEVRLEDEVTVLFSDVKGFTGMTERLPPLELGALLKDYFREMTDALFAQGGTLDKFIGDGLMAVFGAPVAQPDGALRAVTCAWDMLQRLKVLNERFPEDRRITIRIGVNTGHVLAGNFGSPERLEFTVLGDTVNTASRLESIAEAGSVFVGKLTAERCAGSFAFTALGQKMVKGKSKPVEVFQLMGPH
jgi:adenylate cyclase